MKIELDIKSITIVSGSGPDTALFWLNLPDGCWPYEEDKAVFKMHIAAGKAQNYLKMHFPNIPIEFINENDFF